MSAPATLVVPAIGSVWPGQGGVYVGVARGRDGQPDYHLILASEKPSERLTWKAAGAWAKKVEADGHADYSLPTRSESALLYAHAKELFERTWYWTSEREGSSSAWTCNFHDGTQIYSTTSYEGCAVAVRRLPINPSILSTASAPADDTAQPFNAPHVTLRDYFAAAASHEDVLNALEDLGRSGGLTHCTTAMERNATARMACAAAMLKARQS